MVAGGPMPELRVVVSLHDTGTKVRGGSSVRGEVNLPLLSERRRSPHVHPFLARMAQVPFDISLCRRYAISGLDAAYRVPSRFHIRPYKVSRAAPAFSCPVLTQVLLFQVLGHLARSGSAPARRDLHHHAVDLERLALAAHSAHGLGAQEPRGEHSSRPARALLCADSACSCASPLPSPSSKPTPTTHPSPRRSFLL